jgi:hypothetical protein
MKIGRLSIDRRRHHRRGRQRTVISTHHAFERAERALFRQLERRRDVRRSVDVRRVLAELGS